MKNVSYKLQPGDHYIDSDKKHMTAHEVMQCHILEIRPGQIVLQPVGTTERYVVLNERFV